MARLIFLSSLVTPAILLLVAPYGAYACGGGGSGGPSTRGSTTTMASAGGTNSAIAAMSARAMLLSRSAMFRPYARYGMRPSYLGSGPASTASSQSSSASMASHGRLARQSLPSTAPAAKTIPATDPAGDAPSLDLPTRDSVVSGETGDATLTARNMLA